MKECFKKKNLVSNLQLSILSEQIAADFYRYFAGITKDPAVKKTFTKFAKVEAQRHKKLLNHRLKILTGRYYRPNLDSLNTRVRVSKFSLIGALKMAKEAERRAINFYRNATKKDMGYSEKYNTLVKEEKQHWAIIDKLRRLAEAGEYYSQPRGIILFARLEQTWR